MVAPRWLFFNDFEKKTKIEFNKKNQRKKKRMKRWVFADLQQINSEVWKAYL